MDEDIWLTREPDESGQLKELVRAEGQSCHGGYTILLLPPKV